MNEKSRIRISADADQTLVAAIETLATREGKAVAALLDEALADLLVKHGQAAPDIIAAYRQSHAQFGGLYKKLAE